MCFVSGSFKLWFAVFILVAIKYSTSELKIQPTIINCTCGVTGEQIQVPINRCTLNDPSICENENETFVCSIFKTCQTCDVTNRRCASCPGGKYGSRCSIISTSINPSNQERSSRLVKREAGHEPWRSLLGGFSSRSYSQSWMTSGETPSGLQSYVYKATYSQSDSPKIIVIATTKTGEQREFSYNHPLTESWFRERFGERAAIPEDVRTLNGVQPVFAPAPAPQQVHQIKDPAPSPQQASTADWKTLILGDLASRTYSQSWMTGRDTPSGLVSYNYKATYTQSGPQITVTAKTKTGEDRTYTYNHPLTESWFRERFGDTAAIPKDVRILSSGRPDQGGVPQTEVSPPHHCATCDLKPVEVDKSEPPAVSPDISAILKGAAGRTFRQWWYSGGVESSRGFVGYNYTAEYSQSSPTKITIIANSKNGQQTPFHFDKTPPESWFREMFGETVSVPNDAVTTEEQPAETPVTCPSLGNGGEPSPVGTSKTYTCSDDSWRQVGPSTIICQKDGQWSAKPPTCVPKEHTPAVRSICLLPSLSDLMTIQLSRLADGSVIDGTEIYFSCKEHFLYSLQGPSSVVCRKDGTWSGRIPTCVPRKYDDPDCGREEKVVAIINDGESVPNSKPWMIMITATFPSQKTQNCGGSLIHREWVLTAAHCLLIHQMQALRIVAKLDKFNEPLPIERHYIHRQYQTGTLDYDVSLLKLTKPLNRVGVVPVCLPAPGQDIQAGDIGMAVGRGKMNATLVTSPTLQQANLTIISNENCRDWLGRDSTLRLTENMFCATATKGLSSICKGDSGGPMVFNNKYGHDAWTQYGVISWTSEEACNTTETQYSGMVRIHAVMSWIREHMYGVN